MRQAVRLIDATSIRLNALSSAWAQFSRGVCGAKLHVVYDLQDERPIYFVVTKANVNDITPAKTLKIEPGATYVFDLGYYDFGWWAMVDAQGCRIVTRFKKNTPLTVIAENDVVESGNILSDRIGHLPKRLCFSRRNPFQDPVREIRVRIDGGKILRLLTNDLDAPAQEIANLYKSRWEIELFFRWIKQTLKIKRFLGTSQNAVRIQIAVALIAFLLLRAAQKAYGFAGSALAFARLVRANLMHRRPIRQLWAPPDHGGQNLSQMLLEFALC
jgi:IS4 transposase